MKIIVRRWPLKQRYYFETPTKLESFTEIFSHEKLGLPDCREIKKPTTIIDLTQKDFLKTFSEIDKIKKTFNLDYDFAYFQGDKTMYRIYSHFETSQGRRPMTWYEFKQYEGIRCEYGGYPIAAITFTQTYPYLRVRSIFSVPKTREVANGTRRLIYELCLYGKRIGYTGFDLAFVNFKDPAKKGVTDFKMSFNGYVVDEYIYIYKSPFTKIVEYLACLLRRCV